MSELKPCPFCGGEPHIHHCVDSFDDNVYYIQCTKCKLVFNNYWGTYETYDIENEIINWNKRTILIGIKEQYYEKGMLFSRI